MGFQTRKPVVAHRAGHTHCWMAKGINGATSNRPPLPRPPWEWLMKRRFGPKCPCFGMLTFSLTLSFILSHDFESLIPSHSQPWGLKMLQSADVSMRAVIPKAVGSLVPISRNHCKPFSEGTLHDVTDKDYLLDIPDRNVCNPVSRFV